jgi:hypothetical protein
MQRGILLHPLIGLKDGVEDNVLSGPGRIPNGARQ